MHESAKSRKCTLIPKPPNTITPTRIFHFQILPKRKVPHMPSNVSSCSSHPPFASNPTRPKLRRLIALASFRYQITSNPVTNQVKLSTVTTPMASINLIACLSISDNAPLQVAHTQSLRGAYGCGTYIPKEY